MGCVVFLVRHGETCWNHARRYQGHTDIDLSEAGINQAKALSQKLAREEIAAFYSSDLNRAYDTACILAKPHGARVTKLPALREINFGAWEGLTRQEIINRYPKLSQEWWKAPAQTQLPEGENLSEVARRATQALVDIAQKYPEEKVLVAAHGGTIRAAVAAMIRMDLNQYWRIRQDNTALNVIEIYSAERAQLLLFNDTCHLKE